MAARLILYLAVSLDGYLARKDGSVDFLSGHQPDWPGDYGYQDFISGIRAVVMGGNTYREITQVLSPGAWPYEGLDSYVFTSRPGPAQPGVTFLSGDPVPAVRALKERVSGGGIWLCGGGKLASCLEGAGLIDEYQLSVMPILLGEGIPLFSPPLPQRKLELAGCTRENGVLSLRYLPR